MKVEFIRDCKFSPNGWDNASAKSGDIFDIKYELAQNLIKHGFCINAEDKIADKKIEKMVLESAKIETLEISKNKVKRK